MNAYNEYKLYVIKSAIICLLAGFVCWATESPWGLLALLAIGSFKSTDDDKDDPNNN